MKPAGKIRISPQLEAKRDPLTTYTPVIPNATLGTILRDSSDKLENVAVGDTPAYDWSFFPFIDDVKQCILNIELKVSIPQAWTDLEGYSWVSGTFEFFTIDPLVSGIWTGSTPSLAGGWAWSIDFGGWLEDAATSLISYHIESIAGSYYGRAMTMFVGKVTKQLLPSITLQTHIDFSVKNAWKVVQWDMGVAITMNTTSIQAWAWESFQAQAAHLVRRDIRRAELFSALPYRDEEP